MLPHYFDDKEFLTPEGREQSYKALKHNLRTWIDVTDKYLSSKEFLNRFYRILDDATKKIGEILEALPEEYKVIIGGKSSPLIEFLIYRMSLKVPNNTRLKNILNSEHFIRLTDEENQNTYRNGIYITEEDPFEKYLNDAATLYLFIDDFSDRGEKVLKRIHEMARRKLQSKEIVIAAPEEVFKLPLSKENRENAKKYIDVEKEEKLWQDKTKNITVCTTDKYVLEFLHALSSLLSRINGIRSYNAFYSDRFKQSIELTSEEQAEIEELLLEGENLFQKFKEVI